VEDVLAGFALNVQRLLLGEASIAINRAAMASPELRAILLEHGRMRTGAIVEDYLATLMERDMMRRLEQAGAFRMLYGLVIEDRQVRVLLDDAPPTEDEMAVHSREAVERFLALVR